MVTKLELHNSEPKLSREGFVRVKKPKSLCTQEDVRLCCGKWRESYEEV